jgi:peroxiredoxin
VTEQPRRLDPDRAARAAAERAARRRPAAPVVDTRRYQRMIGLLGLALVIAVSAALLTSGGIGTAGIPVRHRLPYFAAPLAASTLNGDANVKPPCTLARHDSRALNVCLLAGRGPLVLAFFVIGSGTCERQVDALQALAPRFPQVQFAAVAVRASHAAARAAVRAHRWTIPVAYDADGAVGQLYGVEVCPIVELSARGGVVKQRLIGGHWADSSALAGPVAALARESQ